MSLESAIKETRDHREWSEQTCYLVHVSGSVVRLVRMTNRDRRDRDIWDGFLREVVGEKLEPVYFIGSDRYPAAIQLASHLAYLFGARLEVCER